MESVYLELLLLYHCQLALQLQILVWYLSSVHHHLLAMDSLR